MAGEISISPREELIIVLRNRYKEASKKEKTRILNEFIAVSGYHRKHVSRLLGGVLKPKVSKKKVTSQLIYNEAVKEALIIIWETADRICSKRLKVVIPDLIEAMERHKHLKLIQQYAKGY